MSIVRYGAVLPLPPTPQSDVIRPVNLQIQRELLQAIVTVDRRTASC